MVDAATFEELAANVIKFMPESEREELRDYLQKALARDTNSELKGELNRSGACIGFSSKSARVFLELVKVALDA